MALAPMDRRLGPHVCFVKVIILTILPSPRPIRGRARGRSSAGTAARWRRRCGAKACGIGPGTPGWLERWPSMRNTQSARRRPKPCGPGTPAAGHGIWRLKSWLRHNAEFRSTPTAVDKRWSPEPQRGRRLKGQSTGGHTEQASNTARGTSERRRTCGSTTTRTAASAEIAVLLRCREMPRPVGPFDSRRPARPRTFPGAHRPNDPGATAPRERSRTPGRHRRA
jgi:hypothetical protein